MYSKYWDHPELIVSRGRIYRSLGSRSGTDGRENARCRVGRTLVGAGWVVKLLAEDRELLKPPKCDIAHRGTDAADVPRDWKVQGDLESRQ